jgi:flagellar hook-associated protein 1 FlgK
LSDFSDLSVGLSGLEANQVGLDTVGQNVANADTPGYVDEQVQLGAVSSVQQPGFDESASKLPGGGVQVLGITRLDNTYLQARSYTEQGEQGLLSAQQSGLQAVQQVFPEPSSSGISSQLTQFWQDWSALASNPSDASTRSLLVQDASTLTSSLNQASTSLSTLSNQTVQDIQSTLQQVNTTASQIASLDQSIAQGTAGQGSANASAVNELEDQRDQLVSQLSSQLGLRVTYNSDGTVNIYSGSEALVSGTNYQQLSLSSSGPPYSLVWSNDQSAFQPTSGELAGMLTTVNQYVPQYQQGLDQVAQSLMGSVNKLTTSGYDLNNNPGAPFFLGTGASDIEVSPAVASGPSLIAAASSAVPAGSSATNEDGSLAAQIGELPNSSQVTLLEPSGGWAAGGSAPAWGTGSTTATGPEADAAYSQLVSGIGQATSAVSSQLTAQQAVTTNVNSALQSATGVNTDEELTNMVMYQNAYDASAKFISTVDATLQSLISMVNG